MRATEIRINSFNMNMWAAPISKVNIAIFERRIAMQRKYLSRFCPNSKVKMHVHSL